MPQWLTPTQFKNKKMKKIISIVSLSIIVTAAIAIKYWVGIEVYKPYRTNGNVMVADSALFVGKLKLPSYSSPSVGVYADKYGQAFGVNTVTKSLNVRGNSIWISYPDSTNIASMILTNFSSADRIKFNAISGTNTGNQALSFSSGGLISINGTGGNTITASSIARASTTVFPDANVPSATSGFYPYAASGSTNYPVNTSSGGAKFFRDPNTFAGYFEFNKEQASTDALRFRTGIDATTTNPWDVVAGRAWADTQYAKLINKQNSLTVDGTGIKYPTVDAVNAGLALKQASLSGTGFIKISGTTITYDNSSYASYPIVNTGLTIAQTSTTLNAAYPSAATGQQVTAPNVGTGMKYEKINTTGGGTWVAWAVTTI